MKKIPTIFERDFDPESKGRLVKRTPHPDCAWVFNGEGVPTRKLDGTACMIVGDALFKRREIKPGKPVPDDFILETEDDETGKATGWVPVQIDDPTNQWHVEAFERLRRANKSLAKQPGGLDGTYELVGPKIQGNPEGYSSHTLVSHSAPKLKMVPYFVPTDFDDLHHFLAQLDLEGIVWHHPDGSMAKIKTKDFGLPRKPIKAPVPLTPWIGVDLDGTLAHYEEYRGPEHIGEPIPEMLERVKRWLADGRDVRIVTARIWHDMTEERIEQMMIASRAIDDWCLKHVGRKLKVTCQKDFGMIELWDDRAVQVEPNTGRPIGQSTRGLS